MPEIINLDGADDFTIVAPRYEMMQLQMQALDDDNAPINVTGVWNFYFCRDKKYTEVLKELSTETGEITISTSYLTINLSGILAAYPPGDYWAYLRKTESNLTAAQGHGKFIIKDAPPL